MERGFTWLDSDVQYNQSGSHGGYRTDCSGFVSMCWELGDSKTTADFISGSGQNTMLGSYEDLVPADALVHRSGSSGHVVLFLGWNDSSHSGACVIEQASTASDMMFHVRSTSSLKSGGYKPIRAEKFANDVGQPSSGLPSSGPTSEDDLAMNPGSQSSQGSQGSQGGGFANDPFGLGSTPPDPRNTNTNTSANTSANTTDSQPPPPSDTSDIFGIFGPPPSSGGSSDDH
jgi:hypothetical protein